MALVQIINRPHQPPKRIRDDVARQMVERQPDYYKIVEPVKVVKQNFEKQLDTVAVEPPKKKEVVAVEESNIKSQPEPTKPEPTELPKRGRPKK